MNNKVYLKGKLVNAAQARVSVFDRGFSYGDGLFETIKAQSGAPLYLKEHLKRLKYGAKVIGIDLKSSDLFFSDIQNKAIARLLSSNRLDKGIASVRITITRGESFSGHAQPNEIKPNVVMIARPIDIEYVRDLQLKGISAITLHDCLPGMPGIKSLNYLPNVLGKMKAAKKGAYEGIFVDKHSGVTEGTSTNIFIVSKGLIKTSPLGKNISEGVLPGVAREVVIRRALKDGLKVVEKKISKRELLSASEVFATNSILGIIPVIKIDGSRIDNGRPGDITRLLQEKTLI